LFGTIKQQYVREEIIYSVPVISMQVGVFCLSSSAPYFIEYFTHDLTDVGIYSVAATFASVVNVFCTAMLQYIHPKIYSLLSQKNLDHASMRKHFYMYVIAMMTATAAVIIVTPLVYHFLLKPSYQPALKYYYLICIGYFFWGITFFFISFLLYYKLKKKLLLFSLSAISISLLMNMTFTKYMGSYGTAIATAISYLLVLVIAFILVKNQILPILQRPKQIS
jgi:O-antigen/teichoic acid export membrane protein